MQSKNRRMTVPVTVGRRRLSLLFLGVASPSSSSPRDVRGDEAPVGTKSAGGRPGEAQETMYSFHLPTIGGERDALTDGGWSRPERFATQGWAYAIASGSYAARACAIDALVVPPPISVAAERRRRASIEYALRVRPAPVPHAGARPAIAASAAASLRVPAPRHASGAAVAAARAVETVDSRGAKLRLRRRRASLV